MAHGECMDLPGRYQAAENFTHLAAGRERR